MVEFDLIDLVDFSIFFEGDGQMIKCLLIAFIIEIGLSEMMMCFDKVEISFCMSIDKNLY